jgi:hypothetical protein
MLTAMAGLATVQARRRALLDVPAEPPSTPPSPADVSTLERSGRSGSATNRKLEIGARLQPRGVRQPACRRRRSCFARGYAWSAARCLGALAEAAAPS